MVGINQATGTFDKEPLLTLASYRRNSVRTTVVIFCSDEVCTHSNVNCDVQGMIMFGLQLVHDKERSPQPHVISLAAPVRILEESGL
jgi:hypothetical protein